MSSPRVVMISLWRNDSSRKIRERMSHLLSKSYQNLRFMWVVGDSKDSTAEILHETAFKNHDKEIEIVQANTRIEGDLQEVRFRRLSATCNYAFARVRRDDDYVVWHESDLISPVDLIERFLATGKCPVAGWPTITITGTVGARSQENVPPFLRASGGMQAEITVFYDVWAYHRDGQSFINLYPYHSCYKPNELFEVDGFGSVCMFHAEDFRGGLRCFNECLLEVCRKMKKLGRSLWVDPTIQIIQPTNLLTEHKKED